MSAKLKGSRWPDIIEVANLRLDQMMNDYEARWRQKQATKN